MTKYIINKKSKKIQNIILNIIIKINIKYKIFIYIMNLLNNLEWFIHTSPLTAKNKITNNKITKDELDIIILNNNIKLALPINDNLLHHVIIEIKKPITVKKILNTIYKFYRQKLKPENYDKAFEDMEEWKDEVLENNGGDITKLTNYDVFTDTCTPDFCGLEIGNDNVFYVLIGPE